MGTFDLTKEYVVSGYWRLEFENDKEYGDYLGTLQYLPDDGCTLTLTFKNKDVPNELRTRAYPQVEISRIVGLTNFGLCHLYDAFMLGSSSGSELSEYRIYVNLASFAIKSDQVYGEKYTCYDLKSLDEQIFYAAEVHFSELFQWIEHMTINTRLNSEGYSFYKKCETCGNIKVNDYYQNWTKVKLTSDITIYFDIFTTIQVKKSGKEEEKPNIKIRIESNKKSLKDFKNIALKLQNIFSIFLDSSPVITDITCIKESHDENKKNDYSCEEYHLLFLTSKKNKQNNFFDTPVKFTSREQFNSMLIKSYSIFDSMSDFFINMQKIDNNYTINLVSLFKIIDGSYKTLSKEENLPLQKNEILKEKLTLKIEVVVDFRTTDPVSGKSKRLFYGFPVGRN